MCLLGSDTSSCTVTGISRTLKEEKYTITRFMSRMEQEGLIDRSAARTPVLTPEGRAQAERYQERVRLAQNYLLCNGMDMEHAAEDACLLALYCSDALIDMIRTSDERYQIKQELRDRDCYTGTVFCRKLKDGAYTFPFIIYREQIKDNHNISMANSGFEHPCTLYVENGEGVIRLRLLPMLQKSSGNGNLLDGRVTRLEYLDSGRFVSAEIHGEVISFPASALTFVNMGTGVDRILHGSVCLRIQCTCGDTNTAEPKALFTILV